MQSLAYLHKNKSLCVTCEDKELTASLHPPNACLRQLKGAGAYPENFHGGGQVKPQPNIFDPPKKFYTGFGPLQNGNRKKSALFYLKKKSIKVTQITIFLLIRIRQTFYYLELHLLELEPPDNFEQIWQES